MVILNSTPGVKRKYVDEKIDDVMDIVGAGLGNDSTLTDAITALQTAVGSDADGLSTKVAALVQTVGNESDGLVKDVASLKTAVGEVTSVATAISDAVSTAKTEILGGYDGSVQTLATAVAEITKENGTIDTAIATATEDMLTKTDAGTTYLGIGAEAESAKKLGTTSVGNATTPVYFVDGAPVALQYTIGKDVPSDANFNDTITTVAEYTGGGNVVSKIIADENGVITMEKVSVATADALKEVTDTLTGYSSTSTVKTAVDQAKADATAAGTAISTLNTNLGSLNSEDAIEGAISTAKSEILGTEFTGTVKEAKAVADEAKATADENAGKLADIPNETVGAAVSAAQTAAEKHADDLLGSNFTTSNTVSTVIDGLFSGSSDSATGTIPSYIENKINTQLSSVYKFKESVTSLPSGLGTENIGEVYNCSEAYTLGDETYPKGTNFVWTGSEWDALAGIADMSEYATRAAINGALGKVDEDLTGLESDVSDLYTAKAGSPVIGSFTATPSKTGGTASISWNGTVTAIDDLKDCIIVEYLDEEAAYKHGIAITAVTTTDVTYTMDYEDGGSVSGRVVLIPAGASVAHKHTSEIPGTDNVVGDGASEPSTANILGRQF